MANVVSSVFSAIYDMLSSIFSWSNSII